MGFIKLSNGETVHASALNNNPCIKCELIKSLPGNDTYINTYKDGTTDTVEITYTISKKSSVDKG